MDMGIQMEVSSEDFVSSTSKSAVLITSSLVSSLIMLDSNIVAVSLPEIGHSLTASFTDIQWVISSYVLTYAALLLASGDYADLRGRRHAMVAGLIIFAIASVACGAATTVWIMDLARAVQGVGGALLVTASLAIISHEFTGNDRAGAFAFWGASLGIALAVGPIVGGAITNFFGWRWVFLVNIPICAILLVAAFRVIAESRDPNAKSLDFMGVITFSTALALFIWALIQGNEQGWTSVGIVLALIVALLAFIAFVMLQRRQPRPMVDFALFERRTFVGAALAMIGYGGSAQVMIFFLPLYLQNVYGFRPLPAGVAMLPFALPMVLAPRLTTRLAARISGRGLLTAGLAITTVGNVLFWAVAHAQLRYGVFIFAMLVAGAGAGLLNGQTVRVMGGAVPADRSGMASGLASTTRFIGILVSVAAMGAILSSVVHRTFEEVATASGLEPSALAAAAKRVTSGDLAGMQADNAIPSSARQIVEAAGATSFAQGFAAAMVFAVALGLLACVLTFTLISAQETAPVTPTPEKKVRPCKLIDCRDPL
jgi:EmrB/QacA subfamily drug resistance transporter